MALTLNTKTYAWSGIANMISTWFERTGGVAAAFSSVTASAKISTSKAERTRINWKLRLPVVATEATSCACPGDVVRSIDGDINLRIDSGMTLAERTDYALRLKDLVASPKFQASIINLEQPLDV